MGLFRKQPINNEMPLFTTGMEITLLIVGLGNPGEEYTGSRHNVGFEVLDNFAAKQEFPGWVTKKDLHCIQTSHPLGNAKVILCKPTTFMNESGRAVQAVQRYYRIDNKKTLIVHDDIDIDFGLMRLRSGGAAAGHNGIKSVIQHCGEDFGRVRIGIGPKKPAQIDSSEYVLKAFSKEQQKHASAILLESNSLLSEYCYSGGELAAETRTFIV